MEDSKKDEMLERINTKIGFDITDKEAWKGTINNGKLYNAY